MVISVTFQLVPSGDTVVVVGYRQADQTFERYLTPHDLAAITTDGLTGAEVAALIHGFARAAEYQVLSAEAEHGT